MKVDAATVHGPAGWSFLLWGKWKCQLMFPGCHSGTTPLLLQSMSRPATETLVLVLEGRVWVKRCIEYVEPLRDIPHLLLFKMVFIILQALLTATRKSTVQDRLGLSPLKHGKMFGQSIEALCCTCRTDSYSKKVLGERTYLAAIGVIDESDCCLPLTGKQVQKDSNLSALKVVGHLSSACCWGVKAFLVFLIASSLS